MTPKSEELLKEALDLPPIERAAMADQLITSLDRPAEAGGGPAQTKSEGAPAAPAPAGDAAAPGTAPKKRRRRRKRSSGGDKPGGDASPTTE